MQGFLKKNKMKQPRYINSKFCCIDDALLLDSFMLQNSGHTRKWSAYFKVKTACGSHHDFQDRGLLLTWKLLNQRFLVVKLKSSLQIFIWLPSWVIVRLYIYFRWGFNYQEGRVGISWTGLTLPHVFLPVTSHDLDVQRYISWSFKQLRWEVIVCGIGDHHRLNFRCNVLPIFWRGPSWPWWYGSWIYNYLCNQCLSPLMLWVRISIRARCTTLCDKVYQWLATGQWFSPGSPVSLVLFKADLIISLK